MSCVKIEKGTEKMRELTMKKKCTICGKENSNHNYKAFGGGYVCEDCISYIRSSEF